MGKLDCVSENATPVKPPSQLAMNGTNAKFCQSSTSRCNILVGSICGNTNSEHCWKSPIMLRMLKVEFDLDDCFDMFDVFFV